MKFLEVWTGGWLWLWTQLDCGGCHKVARLWVSRSFLREIYIGWAFTRIISSENQVRMGQYSATSRICSSSSLILHSVCARRLTGVNLLAKALRPVVCQRIHAECSLGQGVEQLTVRCLWGRKQVYLCKSETSPNQLDRLGMESPLSGERSSWQLVGCRVEQTQNVSGAKRPQMLLTPEEEVAGKLWHVTGA